jgi:hypothetical protein
MQLTREFFWPNRDAMQHEGEKLARRASKLGVSFRLDLSSEPTRVTEVKRGEDERVVEVLRFGTATIETDPIKFAGWKLLGVLSPIPTEQGEIVVYPTAVPGEELPSDVREWTMRCDHCGTVRRRNETFVLRHDDGSLKQVGRQCIKDYLGHDAEGFLARWGFDRAVLALGADEELWGFSGRRPAVWTLRTVLTITSAIVRVEGWVSRKKAMDGYGLTPTATLVMDWIEGVGSKADKFRREHPVEEQDEQAAQSVIDYWLANDDASDYTQSAKLLADGGLVIQRAFGLAVSLLPVAQVGLQRIRERELERQGRPVSQFVGEIGKRQEFTAEVIGTREFPGYAPGTVSTLVTFVTADGCRIKWWASGDTSWLPKPQSKELVTFKATVKEHKPYNGQAETTVQRAAPIVAKSAKQAFSIGGESLPF